MERTIKIGKINFYDNEKRTNHDVEVTLRLSDDNCFSAEAKVWNFHHSDILMDGQCFDTILNDFPKVKKNPIFMEVYDLWENYHLNNFHAGTKAQEDLLKEAVKNRELNTYGANNYKETCAYLESKDMLYDKDYLVSKKQKDGNTIKVPYQYGTGWLKEEIPEEDLLRIKSLITDGIVYKSILENNKNDELEKGDYEYER
jgi:hypothetical protein